MTKRKSAEQQVKEIQEELIVDGGDASETIATVIEQCLWWGRNADHVFHSLIKLQMVLTKTIDQVRDIVDPDHEKGQLIK